MARSLVDAKKAQMKLVNRISHKGIRLLDSNWLPEAQSCTGEPYFIRPTLHATWGRKPCIAMVGMSQTQRNSRLPWRWSHPGQPISDTRTVTFTTVLKRKSEEHESNTHLMVFMLVEGHAT